MSRPSLPAVQLRTRTLGVRLNRHEWDTLVARAAAAGQSPTAYVRATALASSRPARSAAADLSSGEERRELRRIGANLNQIARKLQGGWSVLPAVRELAPVLADLQQRIVDRDTRGR